MAKKKKRRLPHSLRWLRRFHAMNAGCNVAGCTGACLPRRFALLDDDLEALA